MTMKFGLMYEIQIPEPHHDGIEHERYKQVMAQAELADEVGFQYFWTVEHHFLREFSHCSAPEVLYGAISQRTKRIRIGHAVALLPGQYNHPVRVAERAAVLDIVSDGRMDLGTGRSTTLIEMDGGGLVAVVMVAAVGVGHVTVSYDPEVATHRPEFFRAALRHRQYDDPKPIRRGEELGIFHLGSTTIVVFEPGRVELDALAAGASVKMGVGIGRVAATTGNPRG